ncbi:uncharacterized protein ARMOST_16731 [Armillaria ostoyae]|uniref:Uncharacterized protein n=1 Tax=Armillaria ostoyae TaxID=47428 RepID=A0A284RX12_ARMOS|nr:uncharacterized protein ARMOST_16731 [Armillaria ostoyae]
MPSLLVNKDLQILAHSTKQVEFVGPIIGGGDWILERNIIPNSLTTYFVVPNVLVSSDTKHVPVSNPTNVPRYLRKGDVICRIHEANQYLKQPESPEEQEMMDQVALFIKSLAKGEEEQTEEERTDNDETGPKTAVMPDPTIYPSSKIEKLLDVGNLPPELADDAWAMLKRHVRAFGFDGRLGNYPAKAKIRMTKGAQPISLPMYASSPAKREFIDQQIDAWYEKGIIEPSKSPWGAPIVIAYRNNKP